jgi:hypothetical protein
MIDYRGTESVIRNHRGYSKMSVEFDRSPQNRRRRRSEKNLAGA